MLFYHVFPHIFEALVFGNIEILERSLVGLPVWQRFILFIRHTVFRLSVILVTEVVKVQGRGGFKTSWDICLKR